jgi:hypothetical protein
VLLEISAPSLHSLLAVTHFVGSLVGTGFAHGLADSPVAKRRHPLRGFEDSMIQKLKRKEKST